MHETIATTDQSYLQQRGERSALLAWTAFVLMFFMIQAIIWTVAISITATDASHAVIPNYDQQAMNWDKVKAERARSAALGWDVRTEVDARDEFHQRWLTLSVTDANGALVAGGALEARVFHYGRAADAKVVQFAETSKGLYAAQLQTRHAGRWQVDGRLVVGDQVRFVNESFQAD